MQVLIAASGFTRYMLFVSSNQWHQLFMADWQSS